MFTQISRLICALSGIACILCLIADKFWIAELVTHFYLHLAVASLVCCIIFSVMLRGYYAVWMLVLTMFFSITVAQSFAPPEPPKGKAIGSFTILQFNVLFSNNMLPDALSWILQQKADVVVLQEINNYRAIEVAELRKHYKWSEIKVNERRDAFGMAIFSNLPVSKFDYVNIGDGWNHYTLTEIMVAGKKIHLYEIHTSSPVNEYYAQQRHKNLSLMADILEKDTATYRLLVGDLNCTIYSPYFRNITDRSAMHYAQQGYNFEGTWPSFLPMPLRIGIDHIIASQQIKIDKRTVAGYQGSDHLPVITKLILYEEP